MSARKRSSDRRAPSAATPQTAFIPRPQPGAPASPPRPDPGAGEPPALKIVRGIHDGTIDPGQFNTEARLALIEDLTGYGYDNHQIAVLLRLSLRTIQRDRLAYRRRHAVAPSLLLGDELFGELERITSVSNQRLARLARDPGTPHYTRLAAEEAVVRNQHRLVETARRLQYIDPGSRRLAELQLSPEDKRWRLHLENQVRRLMGFQNAPDPENALPAAPPQEPPRTNPPALAAEPPEIKT